MTDYLVEHRHQIAWQPPIKDKDLETSPDTPSKGDRYIVAGTGGDWSGGLVNDITYYTGSAWVFITPSEGWILWVEDENLYYYFDGSNWNIKINWTGTVDVNDYAKYSSSGLVGRSYAEVKQDLSLDNVENTALSTWIGSENITTLGTIATGTWNATALSADKVPNHDNLNGYVADEHIDWTNATDSLLITKDDIGTTLTEALILQNTDTGEVQLSPSMVFKGNAYTGGTDYPIQWWFNPANTYSAGTDFEIRCRIPSIAWDAGIINLTYDGNLGVLDSIEANEDIIAGANVGVGTNTFGTDADKVLCIKNGTIPSTSPADSCQLYAEDVSSGGGNPDSQTGGSSYLEVFSNQATYEHGMGQTITPSEDYTISGFQFMSKRAGSPTVIVKGYLYATSAGLPTDGALAETDSIDTSAWSTSDELHTFTFTTPYALSNGTVYAITMEYISGTYNGSNKHNVKYNSSGGYAGGNALLKSSADAWSGSAGADFIFYTIEQGLLTSELKVRDELGNVTTLSPHNFSLFTPDSSYEFPWSYYSRNDYLGLEINVDMFGAIRALEELTGKQFIYLNKIDKRDWNKDQQDMIDKVKANKESLIKKQINKLVEVSEDDATDADNKLKSGYIRDMKGFYYRNYTEEESTQIIENKLDNLHINKMPKWLLDLAEQKEVNTNNIKEL